MRIWTKNDFDMGLIDESEIGQPKNSTQLEQEQSEFFGQRPEPGSDEQSGDSPPVPFVPLTREQRRAKVQAISDAVLDIIHQNPAAALGDSGSTINKLMELAGRLDEKEEVVKEKPILEQSTVELIDSATVAINRWAADLPKAEHFGVTLALQHGMEQIIRKHVPAPCRVAAQKTAANVAESLAAFLKAAH